MRKPKTWSRKGRCPGCGVGGGSAHNRACTFYYEPTKGKYSTKHRRTLHNRLIAAWQAFIA